VVGAVVPTGAPRQHAGVEQADDPRRKRMDGRPRGPGVGGVRVAGVQKNLLYFYSPSQVDRARRLCRVIRVGGMVEKPGGRAWSLEVRFTLTDFAHT
jgi:hypothetical protein